MHIRWSVSFKSSSSEARKQSQYVARYRRGICSQPYERPHISFHSLPLPHQFPILCNSK